MNPEALARALRAEMLKDPRFAPVADEALASVLNEALVEAAMARCRPKARGRGKSVGLTPREIEVIKLMCAGLTSREIAERIGLTSRFATQIIKNKFARIFAKTGVSTRAELAKWWTSGLDQGVRVPKVRRPRPVRFTVPTE